VILAKNVSSDAADTSSSHLPSTSHDLHLMPCKMVADRADLSKFIEDRGLHFHTLSHAHYATMVLVHDIVAQQRAHQITDDLSPSLPGGGGLNVSVGGVGGRVNLSLSSVYERDDASELQTGMIVAASMCGASVGVDDVGASYPPYHMHCPTG